MKQLLQYHLECLVRHYNISRVSDFDKVDCILYPANVFKAVQEKLSEVPNVIELRLCFSDSPASRLLQAFLRTRPKWSIKIALSTIAPFYSRSFVTPEGLKPLRMSRIYKGGLEREPRWDAYLKSRKQKIPKSVIQIANAIDDNLAASGFVVIPRAPLSRRPLRSASLPPSLRKYSFEFLYFESVSLIRPTDV